MTILPHHVAGVFLVAGLGTGGYFAVRAVTPYSLEEKLTSLKLELETSWTEKAKKYNQGDNSNTIPNIEKNKEHLEEELKKWCEKKKKKPFWDNSDLTYKNFSIWCTVTNKIEEALSKRGLKKLDDKGWEEKLFAYEADKTNNTFIIDQATGAQENKVKKWCETSEKTTYTYEGDEAVKRVLTWCYSN